MFCAAIPAATAVGAKLDARQRQARQEAVARGDAPRPALPIMKLTAAAAAALLLSSITYHTLTYRP